MRTLLALMQVSGLYRRTAGQADRRLAFYRPTQRMRGFMGDWLSYATAALDILEPEGRRASLIGDPAFVNAFSVSAGRAYLEDAVPLVDRVPAPLSLLKDMLGGYSVILAVLLARIEHVPMVVDALVKCEPPGAVSQHRGVGRGRGHHGQRHRSRGDERRSQQPTLTHAAGSAASAFMLRRHRWRRPRATRLPTAPTSPACATSSSHSRSGGSAGTVLRPLIFQSWPLDQLT